MRNIFISLSILLLSMSILTCGGIVSKGPLYESYMNEQPVLESNKSRLFFYETLIGSLSVIRIDGEPVGQFAGKGPTFFYVDVPEGKHIVSLSNGRYIDRINVFEINFSGGGVYYFEEIGAYFTKQKVGVRLLNVQADEAKAILQRCKLDNVIDKYGARKIDVNVVGDEFEVIKHNLPKLKANYGRIFIYSQEESFRPIIKYKPDIQINGKNVGVRKPGTFFFVDVRPGTYEISEGDHFNREKHAIFITIENNENVFIEMFLRKELPPLSSDYLLMRHVSEEHGSANIRYLKHSDIEN